MTNSKYFAEIESNNVVIRIVVSEDLSWCEQHLGGVWVETFMDMVGKNYAGIGYVYYPNKNNFSSPKPYPSWVLDEECKWQPPIPYPNDGEMYQWDEESKQWKVVT